MDSFREVPSDFEPAAEVESAVSEGDSLDIGTDERRMHVRAYNYWVSLLGGRDYPSIEDLEPGDVRDFADHSVLLDFSAGRDNPATAYIGAAIRVECGIGDEVQTIADVPSRSLLSRLTDHYMQIIANRAPVGFEAEFANQREETICYRGILMPFSSDGDTIDFIYGVINWKRSDSVSAVPLAGLEPAAEPDAEPVVGANVPEPDPYEYDQPDVPQVHVSWQDGPLHDGDDEAPPLADIVIDPDAGLADRLCAARESAEAVKAADGRSRTALYRALDHAYDFALAAEDEPEDFADLLEDSGVKAQARAPMTPIVKLVFGIDYDKARLTEFAAALAFARRQDVGAGGFLALIESTAGGLKALVAAERQARRPEPRPDRTEAARGKMRTVRPIEFERIEPDSEFALVLARRCSTGGIEAVALLDDPALVDQAIRRAAR